LGLVQHSNFLEPLSPQTAAEERSHPRDADVHRSSHSPSNSDGNDTVAIEISQSCISQTCKIVVAVHVVVEGRDCCHKVEVEVAAHKVESEVAVHKVEIQDAVHEVED
jgi:hypothetical protein